MNAASQRNTATASPGDSPDSSREGQSQEGQGGARAPSRPLTKADLKRFHLAAYQQAAEDGYSGMDFDHARHGMYTSPKHAAYVVGRWLRETGKGAPVAPHPSRGDLFKVSGLVVRLHWEHIKLPRISLVA